MMIDFLMDSFRHKVSHMKLNGKINQTILYCTQEDERRPNSKQDQNKIIQTE